MRHGDKEGVGLYVHIPFCRRKCSYCAFYSVANLTREMAEAYAVALGIEAEARFPEFGSGKVIPVRTLYLGGGTPSLLPVPFYVDLIAKLESVFDFSGLEEVTMEVNPEHLKVSYLSDLYKYTPVRRLSIGVQTFVDEELKWLNRGHSARDAFMAVENARSAGFTNLSIDLIYGLNTVIPGTEGKMEDGNISDSWKYNLRQVARLDIPHFSAYALTVEPRTVMYNKIQRGKLPDISEERQAREYSFLMDFAQKNGYVAYEISNFARPGMEAVHNSNYWKDIPYIGLGAAAHSYTGEKRWWNMDRIGDYLADPVNSREIELLTERDRYHEYVMTALRTVWGVDENHMEMFSCDIREDFLRVASRQLKEGNLEYENGCWKVVGSKRLLTDGIACDFF